MDMERGKDRQGREIRLQVRQRMRMRKGGRAGRSGDTVTAGEDEMDIGRA